MSDARYSERPRLIFSSPLDVWQDKLIHYVSSDGIVYLVVADDAIGRRTPFAFLQAMEEQVRSSEVDFVSNHYLDFRQVQNSDDLAEAIAHPSHHGLQTQLEPGLRSLMQKFSSGAVKDPLKQAKADMNNVSVEMKGATPV